MLSDKEDANRDSYFYYISMQVGVPKIWLEDCIQEIKLAIWKNPKIHWKTVARAKAIDFVRMYGKHTRSGQDKSADSLDKLRERADYRGALDWEPGKESFEETLVELMDLKEQIQYLTPNQQRLIIEYLAGYRPKRNTSFQRNISLIKKKLRGATAATPPEPVTLEIP